MLYIRQKDFASKLAALPYDVYSRDEAREQVKSTGKLSGDRPPGDPVSKDQDMLMHRKSIRKHDMIC